MEAEADVDMRLDQNQRKTEENRVEGSCNWFSNFRDSLFLVLKFGGYSGFLDKSRGVNWTYSLIEMAQSGAVRSKKKTFLAFLFFLSFLLYLFSYLFSFFFFLF